MPKQTFLNLPEDKRSAFISVALEEFANHDYSTASVSRIVARLGIAKGSLYQYFENKQDLFLYLIDLAQSVLLSAVQESSPPPQDADFFTILSWQMSATVRAALAHPLHARLLQRAYASPLPFRDQMIARAQEVRHAHLLHLVETGLARGDLSDRFQPEVIVLIISAIVSELGPFFVKKLELDLSQAGEIDPALFQSPEIERIFAQVIEILRHGLASTG